LIPAPCAHGLPMSVAWSLAWNRGVKMSIRERRGRDGTVSYQLIVYAGRDGRGRDEYVRRTLTGVARREATTAHAQLLIDVEHGRTGPSRSLTVAQLAQQLDLDQQYAREQLHSATATHTGRRPRTGRTRTRAVDVQSAVERRDSTTSRSTPT